MRGGFAIWIVLVLLVSCEDSKQIRCRQAVDHVADLLIEGLLEHPDQLWDAVHAEPGDPGIPTVYRKATFQAFLDSPDGKAWLERRHAGARAGTRKMIDRCVEQASAAQIQCMLDAKTRAQVQACD
jgi:hypothetical protein